MKKLFESDSAARVQGLDSFAELAEQLNKLFASCPETLHGELES
jgi:hypothetical protein